VRGKSRRELRHVRTRLRGDPVVHSRTEICVLIVPASKSSHAKAPEEGSSRTMGESAGQKQAAMTYPTEELVRRIVGSLLRGDYRGKFFCSSGLVKLARES
jgi:hypothetical protein